MITIELGENLIICRCHYFYKDRIKKVPSDKRFDQEKKAWLFPIAALPDIESEFKGEIYFKTPRWVILGEKEPPKEMADMVPFKVPTTKVEPFDYQRYGYRFMLNSIYKNGFTLNSDSMGLGKTAMSILCMMAIMYKGEASKVLIICKKSVKTQWAEEIRRFTGWDEATVAIEVTRKDKKTRLKAYGEIANAKRGILITNYQNFLNDSKEISNVGFGLVIIDEAHSIKGHDGKMNNIIKGITQGKKTILLTGTPIMSRPDDIYGIVSLASEGFFGTYEEFKERYIVTDFGIYGEQIIGAKNLDELHDKIKGFMIRRSVYDVAMELPEEVSWPVKYEMDEVQEKMMRRVEVLKNKLDEELKELIEKYGYTDKTKEVIEKINEKSKMYIATMQFIADDPGIFNLLPEAKGINSEMKKMVPKNYGISAKTQGTLDFVEDIVKNGNKVIVFSHFATPARMLKKLIESKLKLKVSIYTGGETDDVREKNIKDFKESEDVNILIGTEAMAEGLNLQVASHLINYEQADTFAQKRQRVGRIKRLGSRFNNILVIDPVTEGTYDEVKLNKLSRDERVSDSILGHVEG